MRHERWTAMIQAGGSIPARERTRPVSFILGLSCLTLLASAPGLLGQDAGRVADVAAEYRRVAQSRDFVPDSARAHRLFELFAASERPQAEDTIVDTSGQRAIYRHVRSDAQAREVERLESALVALHSIDKARLLPRDALSHDIMRSEVTRGLRLARAPRLDMPLTEHRGLHLMIWFYGSEFLPAGSAANYEVILAHLNGVSLEIDEMMQAMRQAQAQGIMPPRAVMTGVADSLRRGIVSDPMESGYLVKFSKFPGSIPAHEQERLRASAVRIYSTRIRPAYERLLTYATESYIPEATESIGLSALPGGAERYAAIVQRIGSTDLSPAQLHDIALKDVARHRIAIDSFRVAMSYAGSYRQFLEFLRTDSRFAFADSAAYIRAARDLAKRIDANIFTMFRTIPRLPFGIEGASGAGGGFYQRGSLADQRSGSVRLFVSSSRPGRTWLLPAIVLHEGVPGHHFSHALNLERELAPFQRQRPNAYPAYTEGWGMYAETMGKALSVYDDEYSSFGQLSGSMWRAIRVVLDTGIHGLGWTRGDAVTFARENSPQPEANIQSEVGAIIESPGFLLPHKLGQWKFLELRALAERELGSSFDIRAFNDALLENGEMPLDVLDMHMREWLARRRPSPK